jgi:hypothetical protein
MSEDPLRSPQSPDFHRPQASCGGAGCGGEGEGLTLERRLRTL